MSGNAFMQIGASKDAVQAVKAGIMEILKAPRGDEVIVKALEVFRDGVKVEGTSISHCTFTAGEAKK